MRTALLLAAMTGLFLAAGFLIGGQQGMVIAFVIACAMNLFAYWNADKLVLRMYGAEPVDETTAPEFHRLVSDLAARAGLPKPKIYIIDNPQPNAFATGRNPENAAVAATTGLLKMLSRDEIEGVMAHELAHVKNRDSLIMTVTAVLAGAIGMLANFAFFFGGSRDRESPLGGIGALLVMLLAPIAAMLVQFAISRSREYEADRIGAAISGRAALARLGARQDFQRRGADPEQRRRNPIRRPRTCSSSTRCPAAARTACSPPTRRRRSASTACWRWRATWRPSPAPNANAPKRRSTIPSSTQRGPWS